MSKSFQIQRATLPLVPSLTTIVARSFHPVNPFHRRAFPRTPLVLDWFSKVFTDEVNNSSCQPLVAVDPNASSPDLAAIGILLLRKMKATEPGAGMWSMYPYTADHDEALFGPAIDLQADWRQKLFADPGAKYEGQEHFVLELFGADHEWKGTGVGKALLSRACELADEEGLVVFVEANASAKGFYEKSGFVEVGRLKMPSEDIEYWEFLLVREGKV